jgi:hypothetical protein
MICLRFLGREVVGKSATGDETCSRMKLKLTFYILAAGDSTSKTSYALFKALEE